MADKSYEQLLDQLEESQRELPDERLVAELGQIMVAKSEPVLALPAPEPVVAVKPIKVRRRQKAKGA